jgi:plasmid maintenance system antidote protein VapI
MNNEGEILRQLIKQSGVNVTNLCKMIGVSRSVFYHWINRNKISADRLILIGKVLRMDMTVHFPRLEKIVKTSEVKKYAIEENDLMEKVEEIQSNFITEHQEIMKIKEKLSNLTSQMDAKDDIINRQQDEILFLRQQVLNKDFKIVSKSKAK